MTALLERLSLLHPKIADTCIKTGTPGLAWGISIGGKTIARESYGFEDLHNREPVTSDTLFGLGSISKAMTASAVAQLVYAGKLEWSTPVRTILPQIESISPAINRALTIEDLLAHRTGLSSSNQWWYGADGDLLISKDETIPFWNTLRPKEAFRESFSYSNWNYAIAGLLIEKLSGQSLGNYMSDHVWKPLGMDRSTANLTCTTTDHVARPYAALDDASMELLPMPKVHDGTAIFGAMGFWSSVNDMLVYSMALLEGLNHGESNKNPLQNVKYQLASHNILESRDDSLERAYAFGFRRNQLPSTFGSGCNGQFVSEMPTIRAATGNPLVLYHGGSLAGFTGFLALIPDLDASIIVLSNSIALADPVNWAGQMLLEAVVASPTTTDFTPYVLEAARTHANSTAVMFERFKSESQGRPPSFSFSAYTGIFRDPANNFVIAIDNNPEDDGLQVTFASMPSQTWSLTHHDGDSFHWLAPRDEQAKRARFTYSPSNVFKINFKAGPDGTIDRLRWPHEPGLAEEEQEFFRVKDGETAKCHVPAFSAGLVQFANGLPSGA